LSFPFSRPLTSVGLESFGELRSLFAAREGDACMKDTDHPIRHLRDHLGDRANPRKERELRGTEWAGWKRNDTPVGLERPHFGTRSVPKVSRLNYFSEALFGGWSVSTVSLWETGPYLTPTTRFKLRSGKSESSSRDLPAPELREQRQRREYGNRQHVQHQCFQSDSFGTNWKLRRRHTRRSGHFNDRGRTV